MKLIFTLIFTLLSLILSFTSFATVDSNTRVFILVRHVQSGDYFVERAPIVGCWGYSKGPELSQLTKPYVVGNLGCGMDAQENINALTCAKVENAIEADDSSTFKEIVLNISDCEEKKNPDFIEGIKKTVRVNFATKSVKNPILVLKL